MPPLTSQPLSNLWIGFSDFLPALASGLLVIAVGIVLGWLAKRTVVRTLVWLRLDRLASRVGWRAGFSKGDVRAALYDAVGNLVFLAIVLIFVDDALNRWGLLAISRVIDTLVFYLPNVALVALVLVVGIVLSNALAARVVDTLQEEGIGRPRLVGKAVKAALLGIVCALALWQLRFAREIVLATFLIAFGSVGVAFAIGAGLGMARAIQEGLTQTFQKKRDEP